MHIRHIIILLYVFCLACGKEAKVAHPLMPMVVNNPTFQWESIPDSITAGTPLQLKLKTNIPERALQLFVSSSWCQTALVPIKEKDYYLFNFPSNLIEKAGYMSYQLHYNKQLLDFQHTYISPLTKTDYMETYFGPQFIVAGYKDFATLVTIPTDVYDNPNKADFDLHYLYKDNLIVTPKSFDELIHWQRVDTKPRIGKIYLASKNKDTGSKQQVTTIAPSYPIDFTINFSRNHPFADGKEITTLRSSVIYDNFENPISDGFIVTFIIKTKSEVLKAYGTTLNSMAYVEIAHPDEPDTYTITAMITGFASSNTITIKYDEMPKSLTKSN